MSHLRLESTHHQARDAFTAATRVSKACRAKSPPPFSLRLSTEERARLEAAAAGVPLGAYIRGKLFDGDNAPPRRRVRAPVKDHAALAQVLGMLGAMRISSNLNQLARAANMGALPVSEDVEEELGKACAAVLAIKAELMRALGYQDEDGA